MKLSGKNLWEKKLSGKNNRAIDSLLRAYVSRPTNRVCSEFDPDLASAYAERCLPDAARARYEQHLCECASCRKNVIALFRLAEPELRASSVRAIGGFDRRQHFGLASWPRWAMAAAAVLVIAVSLPLFLTRKLDRSNSDAILAVAESPAPGNAQSGSQPKEPSAAPAAKVSAANPTGNGEPKPTEKASVDAVSSNAAPAQQPGVAGGDQASVGGKREAGAQQPAATEQVTVTSSAQPSDAAAGQAQPAKQSDQQGVVADRRRQNAKDAEADSKSKANESEETKKEQVSERAAIVPPPAAPAPAPDSVKTDKLKHSAGRLGLRDSSSAEAVRPNLKTVGGKKFSLKNDTWTDKEFDPDKDLPIVTVIRDSNVYNELLGKRAGLKKYFDGFQATDRAIIVYKGTVYKLIPQ